MKKKIIAMCATVALAAVAVGGTLAYFTDQDEATNTFTVGKVDIELEEPAWDDNTDQEKVIIPGKVIDKDPTVTVVQGSEDCYVRMLVTVENLGGLKAAFPGSVAGDGTFLLQDFVDWNSDAWKYEACTVDGDTAVYEFRYSKIVKKESAGELPELFTKVTIPATATNESLSNLGGSFDIDIVAQAIQAQGADGTNGYMDADAAWEAFKA